MNWLTDNWHGLIREPWLSILLVLLAALCGALVGAEREKKEKPIGTRTLTLVSLGAAVFTMVSFGMGGSGGDRGRIAAQIVSGIGFLGAGAIIRGRYGITGLTSAATIWAVAAAGMVVGAGYAGAGLAVSILIVAILTVISAWEQKYLGRCRFSVATVTFAALGGRMEIKIEEILDEYNLPPDAIKRCAKIDGETGQMEVTYCHVHKHHREFLAQIAEMPDVQEIRRQAFSAAHDNPQ